MGAVLKITDISFPGVAQGEIVSGTVTVENIGDEPTSEATGYSGILVKSLWDGQEHPLFTYYALAPGATYPWLFPDVQGGIGAMPAGLAEVEITARRWMPGEVWEVDDVVFWSIDDQEPLPTPSEGTSILGKVGAVVATAGFVGIVVHSARKR